jgi:hypothetical protein
MIAAEIKGDNCKKCYWHEKGKDKDHIHCFNPEIGSDIDIYKSEWSYPCQEYDFP